MQKFGGLLYTGEAWDHKGAVLESAILIVPKNFFPSLPPYTFIAVF